MIDLREETLVGLDGRAFDLCIIGTGPAGSTLVEELAGTDLHIVVLESGSPERTERADRLDEVENVGRERLPDQWSVRNRVVGGSSHTWGGRSAPFDPIDFEQRPWVPASGWPFGFDDLAPYLDRSARHLGLVFGTGFSGSDYYPLAGRPVISPSTAGILPFFWQFSRDPGESYPYEYRRFGRDLAGRLGRYTTLVSGATVTEIVPDDTGRAVKQVEYAAPDGNRYRLEARAVVLATGGIENARLLLASTSVEPAGLGNDHDLVGRYLMDHPRGPVGTFPADSTQDLVRELTRSRVRGRFFRAGFRLSPDLQRAEGLLNCSAWVGEQLAVDDPWDAGRRLWRREPTWRTDVGDVVRGLPVLVRGAGLLVRGHVGLPRRFAGVELAAMVEQRPDAESRVTLSERRDAHGSPLARIDWRVHPEESRTLRRAAQLVSAELRARGYPAPVLEPWVLDGAEMPSTFLDVGHPTGTTRMSESAARGVVDADGQVHGVKGLFVVGSSTFPTSGHCNPTQMIVAMAVRLADHLRDHLEKRSVTAVGAGGAGGETVLVTGATGRIGTVLVEDLLERGYRVRATTSRSSYDGLRPDVTWRRLDLADTHPTSLDKLLEGCAAVVHLAAEIGAEARMQAVNGDGTRALAEAAERCGVGAFVYTSTVSVYGSSRHRRTTETSPVLDVDRDVASQYLALSYVRAYGRTKLAGEHAIAATAGVVPYVVLRPAVVVGERGLLEIGEWSRSKRWFAAHRHAHHVYDRDVADAIIWSLRRGLDGHLAPGQVATFNVAEDDRVDATHAAFLRKAYDVTGDRRFRVLRLPGLLDRVHDLVRFRRLSLRNPLWRMRFPTDALDQAGYVRRFGMRTAEARALDLARAGGSPGAEE